MCGPALPALPAWQIRGCQKVGRLGPLTWDLGWLWQSGCSCNQTHQLLAGAKVNELTKHRQTALHLAAQQDLPTICSVLLENGVDFAAVDENGNNGKSQSLPVCSAQCLKQPLPSRGAGAAPFCLSPFAELGSHRSRASSPLLTRAWAASRSEW